MSECTTVRELVDVVHGSVRREAFVSPDIYKLELNRIFERTWTFLAHESEIPEVGNYLTRNLGNAPVIVIRDAPSSVRAFLNSCRHRGAKLCRTDSGTLKHFVCPYHGWTYARHGKLMTTTFDYLVPKDMDFEKWSLIPVPRVETYKGLIFGCWDSDVASLVEYLGDFRWYLDAFFARSPKGMEVLAPPHKWRSKANWKIGALNFIGDGTHNLTTHAGPLSVDPLRSAQSGFAVQSEKSVQVITDGAHGLTLNYLGDKVPDWANETHSRDLLPLYAQTLAPGQKKLLDRLRVSVGNVFPNLSFIEAQVGQGEKSVIMRLWHPLSATEMEVLSWVLAEREASPDYKQRVLRNGFHNFGAGGVFEQDDLELWESATIASNNNIAQNFPYSFVTAIPYMHSPVKDYEGPGRAYRPAAAEVIQLEFMHHWARLMSSQK
jgi:PAH dioxygenase large subunit